MVPEQTLKVLLTGSSVYYSWSPVGGSVSYKRAILLKYLATFIVESGGLSFPLFFLYISYICISYIFFSICHKMFQRVKVKKSCRLTSSPCDRCRACSSPNITIEIILLFYPPWDALLMRARGWREGQIGGGRLESWWKGKIKSWSLAIGFNPCDYWNNLKKKTPAKMWLHMAASQAGIRKERVITDMTD